MSKRARRLHSEAMRNIQATTGTVVKSAVLSDYILGLCEAATAGERQVKRVKALARAVKALQANSAAPPMPPATHKPVVIRDVDPVAFVNGMNKAMNGHSFNFPTWRPDGQQSE